MAESFFEISHPRHMFNKAEREFEKMKANVNTDTVFNFFVTALHIKDYVNTERADLIQATKNLLKDKDLHWCDYICQRGKHLEVRDRALQDLPPLGTKTAEVFGTSVPGKAVPGWALVGSMGVETKILVAGGKPIDVVAIGERVLEKWERFLEENGLWAPSSS